MFTFNIDEDGFVQPTEFQFAVPFQKEVDGRMYEDEASVAVKIKEDFTDVEVSVIIAVGLNDEEKAQICDHVRNEVNSGNIHLPTLIPMSEIDFGNHEGYYHQRQTPEQAAEAEA